MSKSGAVMAWEYFHKDKPVPALLKYIQDGDLWKFELEFTKEVRAALPMLEDDMGQWDLACTDLNNLNDLFVKGKVLLQKDAMKIASVLKNDVKVLPYKGYKAGVYNTTVLVSEIGSAVYNSEELGVDFSMSFFVTEKGEVVISFRSKGDMDVSVFAKELGGGGHKNAAGAGRVNLDFLKQLYQGML
jgi:oligoribonuclease NrnB/cAMP/cGMP phosphodiesterase (DHH superfamily)